MLNHNSEEFLRLANELLSNITEGVGELEASRETTPALEVAETADALREQLAELQKILDNASTKLNPHAKFEKDLNTILAEYNETDKLSE